MACGLFFRLFFAWIFFTLPFCYHVSANDSVHSAYRLPDHHPIKPFLDKLFSTSRVILNLDSLKKAGFVYSQPRKFTNLVIARHPALPGYIFKIYLDAQRHHKNKPEHHFWMLRVEGALRVRREIEVNNLQEFIKVPQKWIYKLPKRPSPPKGYASKKYILVEEDMNLLSQTENENLWASSLVTAQHLNAVYLVLKKVGLSDCAKPDNIPFSVDGRLAFIDTQTHGGDVPFDDLTSWLSTENQAYWQQLTK